MTHPGILPSSWTRRRFLAAAASAAAAAALPRRAWARLGPNEQLRVAAFGVGGMGASDLEQVAGAEGVRIVALCDVDAGRLGAAASKHAGARTYQDWRRLLDAMDKDIDAVTVSTPDHMHGPIALAAMDLGKHVYCQKPIAHNLRECRAMAELAARRKVVTQMGTQIHGHTAYRTAVSLLQQGALGKVSEAHLWVSKSWAGPNEGRPAHADPVPATLDWDLWLGVAPTRPYVNAIYHPAQWRGWRDFGGGTLGDMGCHLFDPVFAGLGLTSARRVVSHGPAHAEETFAADGDIHFEFAGTAATTDPLHLRWTDGSGASRPAAEKAQLPAGESLPGAGSFLVGEHGVMVLPHWDLPRFYRGGERWDLDYEPSHERNHYHEWVAACRGDGSTSTPFAFSGPLTEAVLLGTIAGGLPEQVLEWNAERLEFDAAAANRRVGREYREGWRPATLGGR